MSQDEALTVFCGGEGLGHPDILATFERASPNASAPCVRNEIGEVVELKVRYEIAVLVRSVLYGPMLGLSPRHVFLALAKEVPNPDRPQELIENPYRTWSEVDRLLEPDPIRVIHGQSSDGRNAIAPILDAGCNDIPWIAALKSRDAARHARICQTTRDVGVPIDGDLISFLQTYPTVLGVLDYRSFDMNRSNIVGMPLRGVEPTREAIAAGTYPGSRALFLYVKRAQVRSMPGMRVREFVESFLPLARDWPLLDVEEWRTMRDRAATL
jgi:phosphate transport system substrate-binding protein